MHDDIAGLASGLSESTLPLFSIYLVNLDLESPSRRLTGDSIPHCSDRWQKSLLGRMLTSDWAIASVNEAGYSQQRIQSIYYTVTADTTLQLSHFHPNITLSVKLTVSCDWYSNFYCI